MGQESVLALLLQQSGQYLSGETMSQQLGVSRTAIWKSIAQLKEQGYEIDSVKNKGYALLKSPDRLDKVVISQGFAQSPIGGEILCLPTIDSTNNEVKRLAMAGAKSGLVVTAEEQTQGKGRRGRQFHSPPDTGLYMSVLLRPQCTVETLTPLTAWVAVAVAEGIAACASVDVGIKWTNDLLLGGKKLSGILTELALETQTNFVEYVVIGIGINVNHQKCQFPLDLQDISTSLYEETGEKLCRNRLCRSIISALNRMISSFPQGKEDYLEKYRQRCLTLGQDVFVLRGGQKQEAKALEIDDEFRLLVSYPQGTQEFLSSGDVSVRGKFGYI